VIADIALIILAVIGQIWIIQLIVYQIFGLVPSSLSTVLIAVASIMIVYKICQVGDEEDE